MLQWWVAFYHRKPCIKWTQRDLETRVRVTRLLPLTWQFAFGETLRVQFIRVLQTQERFGCSLLILLIREKLSVHWHVWYEAFRGKERESEREKRFFFFIRHGLKVSGVCWRRKKKFKNEKLITFNDTVLCPMRIKYSTLMAVLWGQVFLNNEFNCITDWFPALSSCGSCLSLGCKPRELLSIFSHYKEILTQEYVCIS